MAINTKKLLPPASSFNQDNKKASKNNLNDSNLLLKEFTSIRSSVIKIDKLLTNNLNIKKKYFDFKRKSTEKDKFKEKEKRLEENKEKKPDKKFGIDLPQLSFFDKINRFITFTFLGWLTTNLLKYIPKLLEFTKKITPVLQFIESFVGNVFKGIVDFIDFGYDAHKKATDFAKNLGGEDFQKTFDDFSGNLNKFINLAIVAGMATMGGTDFGLGKEKPSAPGTSAKPKPGQGGRPKVTTSGGGPAGRPDIRKLLRSKPKITTSGGKAVGRFAGIGGRIPIIGGLVSFIINVLSGEPVGRSAAKAVGFSIGSALGSFVPVPLVGTILGGILGDIVGGALYDTLTANKPKKPEIKAKKTGGQVTTRKGKVVSGQVKRTVRSVVKSPPPVKLQPGKSVGGENTLKKIYPEPKANQTGKYVNSYGFLSDTVESFSQISFIGHLFNLFGKVLMGDEPNKTDYRNIGLGINAWINNAISIGLLQGNLVKAFADGGVIDGDMTKNISGWVENSVEDLIKNKVTEAINKLKKNLGLQPLQESIPSKTLPTEDGEMGSASDAVGGARLFMEVGFPPLAAAILSGNVQAESGWKGQRTPWVLNDGAGTNKGLISWNRSRIINAEKFLGKPLETASNAEQVKWIKEELKQYGLLDEFMDPNRTEQQLKNDSYKYIGWGIEGDRWKYSSQIFAAIQRGEKGTYVSSTSTPEKRTSGYAPSKPGLFNAIEYITGDRRHPNFELAGHGLTSNYHDHIAFKTVSDKERAKRALRASNIQIGSELRPGDRGYHGVNLAIDIPGAQWKGSGAIGQKEFEGSKKVRQVLGLKDGGIVKSDMSKKTNSIRTQLPYEQGLARQYIILPIVYKQTAISSSNNNMPFSGGGSSTSVNNNNYSRLFVS